MRRRVVHPYGHSISAPRLASLILAVAVLWMFYGRMKDPATWRIFADEKPATTAVENAPRNENETVVPGPNHKNEDELAAAQHDFELIIDKAPLKSREMDAYWRLMAWSRSESFADLGKQARRDVPFTLLFEQPERYRGQPIQLRLHVRRVLEHDKPENPLGLAKVYEAWGTTDESSTFPYVVIFPERPEGLPLGDDIRSEVVFVGYMLKVMSYTDKLGKTRGSPLLVGRVQHVATPPRVSNKSDASTVLIAALVCGVVLVGSLIWIGMRPRKRSAAKPLPGDLPEMGAFDSKAPGDGLFSSNIDSESRDFEQPVIAIPDRPDESAKADAAGVSESK